MAEEKEYLNYVDPRSQTRHYLIPYCLNTRQVLDAGGRKTRTRFQTAIFLLLQRQPSYNY